MFRKNASIISRPRNKKGVSLRGIMLWLSFAGLFAIWLAAGDTGEDDPEHSVHGPIIQWHRNPANSATIVWVEQGNPDRLSTPVEPTLMETKWTLQLRPKNSEADFQSVQYKVSELAKTGNPVYQAVATGLRSDTAYAYQLQDDDDIVEEGWFRTAPEKITKPMRFIVGGDMGTEKAIPLCRIAGEQSPLFVLVGGDIAYANGRNAYLWYRWIDIWTEYVHSDDGRAIPMIIGIGNHEMKSYQGLKGHRRVTGLRFYRKSPKNAPFYYSLFDLPEGKSNFTVDFGDYMSIILLDSNHSQKVRDQTTWLEAQLEQRQDWEHLFAIYHRPAWGTGIKPNMEVIQEEWCPLFVDYEVDCVFENDHHTYKRSYPLIDGQVDRENGIRYIGDGAWGARLRPITQRMLNEVGAAEYLAHWESIHHFVRATIKPDGSRQYEAINTDGKVFDSVTDPGEVVSKRQEDPDNQLNGISNKL